MNEYVSMSTSQCYENGYYVKGVLTCIHSHFHAFNEWMKLMNGNEKGSFWGEHSLWFEMKCLLGTSLPSKSFEMYVWG